ncbi:hypothetical protein [Glutamicibacter nicotianae]|nr:hypothetical protein [Glutamicibacter nicotianae]WIV42598.1 hypothetical protein QQS42_09660 [Glutamicibacter nicotianae]
MDSRAALDSIYEYITAKRDADTMADFESDDSPHPNLERIAKKFAEAMKN